MINKTFGMISLGCDKNRVDGERLLGEVKKMGCKITDDLSEAQVLIVNTCAFLNASRKEAIDTVLEANGYRSGKLEKIVVSGCLPQKYIGELFPALTEGDVFLGVNDAPLLMQALEKSYAGERVNCVGKCSEPVFSERVLTTSPHLAYLKISDGCYHHCTYCLIPKIRGKYRSFPMETLIDEAAGLGEVEELVFVAQDTSRYGEDLYGENKFVELIQAVTALKNIGHVRLLYCYPEKVTDELIREIKQNPKVLHYLDIPLQHSDPVILKRMGRKGTREEYLALFAKLRREIPDIAIRTTFIAGFPGETEEAHADLLAFLDEAKLTNCGFFAYSREPETPAYSMSGQVHHARKKRWVKELYIKQAAISREYLSAYVGKTVKVLCDGVDFDRSCFRGRAYFQAEEIDGNVFFQAPEAETGKIYDVFVTESDEYDLYGTMEDNQ